jgi:integrase
MAVRKVVLADGSVRWRVRVYAGTDDDGHQTVVTKTFLKKKEADLEEARLKSMKGDGALTAPSKESLSAFVTRWLDNVKEGELHPKTLSGYRQMMRRYLDNPPAGCPPIGKIRLNALTYNAFQELYTFQRRELNLSPRTIRLTATILRQAMKYAVKVGALPKNPSDGAVVPKRKADTALVLNDAGVPVPVDESKEAMKKKTMTKEQATAFMAEARTDRYFPLWHTLLYSGMRPGEAYALMWPDIDFEAGTIHVQRTLTRAGLQKGEPYRLMPTKTDASVRVIPVPATTVAVLKEWKTAQKRERVQAGAEYRHQNFVFTIPGGQPLRHNYVATHHFKRILERAGLGTVEGGKFTSDFSPYSLRHTHASLLMLAATNPKVVSERLGHSSVKITLDIYSHVLSELAGDAADRLETLLAQG